MAPANRSRHQEIQCQESKIQVTVQVAPRTIAPQAIHDTSHPQIAPHVPEVQDRRGTAGGVPTRFSQQGPEKGATTSTCTGAGEQETQ